MFKCDCCGACCRHLNLSALYAELDRGDGTCKYLSGNLCSIYEKRPLLCRVDTNVAAKEIHLTFTHLHDDHFSGKQVRDFMRKYPTAKICMPEMWISGVNLDENIRRTYILDLGRSHLTAFPTVHDGKEYAKVPHQSLMLQASGQQHLICGDALLDLSLARHVQRACPGDICAAFVNVYQLASKPGQAFLKAICPRHIFLYHLPFKEDDIFPIEKSQ